MIGKWSDSFEHIINVSWFWIVEFVSTWSKIVAEFSAILVGLVINWINPYEKKDSTYSEINLFFVSSKMLRLKSP